MSKDHESTVSRRRFAQEAGIAAVALTTVGTAIAADVSSSPARPMMASHRKLRSNSLAKLSNVLYNSPDERRAFLADPQRFATRLGVELNRQDLGQVKNMLADGFCCHGCGCSGGALEEQEKQQQ